MEMHRLPPSVRRVTLLEKDESGAIVATTIYRKSGRKRKVTPALRPVERAVRRLVKATGASANSYVSRHERSSQKKKDGWLRDANWNVAKSLRTGVKQLKVNRPLYP